MKRAILVVLLVAGALVGQSLKDLRRLPFCRCETGKTCKIGSLENVVNVPCVFTDGAILGDGATEYRILDKLDKILKGVEELGASRDSWKKRALDAEAKLAWCAAGGTPAHPPPDPRSFTAKDEIEMPCGEPGKHPTAPVVGSIWCVYADCSTSTPPVCKKRYFVQTPSGRQELKWEGK